MQKTNSESQIPKQYQSTALFKSKFVCLCLVYIAANCLPGVFSQTTGLTVKIPQGEITGTFETYKRDGDDVTYSVFRGIPYAKAPVGPLRLKEPEKHERWSSSFDASNFGSICPQWDFQGKIAGDEDCLFINVYTPMERLSPTPTYPVMVFIHGGFFQKGSSNPYEQQRFIENGVILVTFNYRLGILGFLSTEDDVCPGNLGLKDQVLALEWVRDNIKYFGGNLSAITLYGQGAGAVSAFLHILSPKSQGLFQQAIAQSGFPFCDWTLEENPRSYSTEVAQSLGCSTKSSSTIVDCIRGKSLQEVLQAQKDNKTFGNYPLRAIPVIEREGFLPASPSKLLESGDFKPVPLISGVNKDDGAILYPLIQSYEDMLRKNSSFLLTQLIPRFLLTATDIRGNIESVALSIYYQYFNGIDPTNVTQVLQPFVNVSTDAMFSACNFRTLQSYSAKGAKVYMYTFEYKGEYSMLQLQEGNKYKYDGVSHGDELMYLFDMADAKLTLPYDVKKKEQMNYLWINFAKTGGFPLSSSSEFPRWEPYNPETKYYYKIDSSITRQSSYRQREIDFWLNFLPALSNITMPADIPNVKYQSAGFGWAMLIISVILLALLIAVIVLYLRKSRKQHFATKTEDK